MQGKLAGMSRISSAADAFSDRILLMAQSYYELYLFEHQPHRARKVRMKIIKSICERDRREQVPAELWVTVADMYVRMPHKSKYLLKALKVNPASDEVHAELALIAAKQGRFKTAKYHIKIARLHRSHKSVVAKDVTEVLQQAAALAGASESPRQAG